MTVLEIQKSMSIESLNKNYNFGVEEVRLAMA